LQVGLTAAEIAATRSIYHFPSTTGSYAAGLDAYRAPLANGGDCIAFAARLVALVRRRTTRSRSRPSSSTPTPNEPASLSS
jgi:hypothetical protein